VDLSTRSAAEGVPDFLERRSVAHKPVEVAPRSKTPAEEKPRPKSAGDAIFRAGPRTYAAQALAEQRGHPDPASVARVRARPVPAPSDASDDDDDDDESVQAEATLGFSLLEQALRQHAASPSRRRLIESPPPQPLPVQQEQQARRVAPSARGAEPGGEAVSPGPRDSYAARAFSKRILAEAAARTALVGSSGRWRRSAQALDQPQDEAVQPTESEMALAAAAIERYVARGGELVSGSSLVVQ
jgi:hypothetical protein